MIFCGPNGQCYEFYTVSVKKYMIQDRWLKFYLDNGIYVCLWNYRSFGESSGSISFEAILN